MKFTLKAARVNAGMSQEEAAARLGISCVTLRSYERGESFPAVPMILKIEALYGVPFGDLIFLPGTTVKRCQEGVQNGEPVPETL